MLNYISQPSTFWTKTALQKTGGFNEKYSLSMDYEYWVRLSANYNLNVIDKDLSCFRVHTNSKSTKYLDSQLKEGYSIASLYSHNKFQLLIHKLHDCAVASLYRFYI